jgi:hypothetical protein
MRKDAFGITRILSFKLSVGGMMIAAFWGTGCSAPEAPMAPSTNFVMSLPVADDSTRIAEVVRDRSGYLQLDENSGGMNLQFSGEVGRADVGDNLTITPTGNSFGTALGNIILPGESAPPISIGLSELVGQDVPVGSTLPLVPSSDVDFSTEFPLEDVISLTIEEGSLSIAVSNGLPVVLDGLALTLVDLGNNGIVVDETNLGRLDANGGSGTGVFSLDGKTISGSLGIQVVGKTLQALNITVGADASLDIEIEVSELEVSRAFANLPSQEFSASQSLEFPDDRIQVTRAVIGDGALVFSVKNDIATAMEIELSLDDLKDAVTGESRIFLIDDLAFGETREVRFDLASNEFRPSDPLKLGISYNVRTINNGEPIEIRADGELQIEAQTEALVLERVEGRLNQVGLTTPTAAESVEFPDGLNNVAVGSTEMEIFITSAVGFQASVEVDIQGTNSFGETKQIFVEQDFERGNAVNPVPIKVVVAPDELKAFINSLPTELSIKSKVLIGDGLEEEVISNTDWVSIDSVVFRSSPRLTLLDETNIEPDERDITFRDSEIRRKVDNNFVNARVITEIENSIPLGVGIRLYVSNNPATIYTDPILTVPPLNQDRFQVDAAPVDDSGRSSGTSTRNQEIILEKKDVLKFILEDDGGNLYSGVRVTLPATTGEVEVLGTDYVNIIAGLQIEVLLDDKLVE